MEALRENRISLNELATDYMDFKGTTQDDLRVLSNQIQATNKDFAKSQYALK
jgi:hypothetical protein